MEHNVFTSLKVNNEIELCKVIDMEFKQLIERELLKNRISYFVKWTKSGLLRRKPEICIFCINENDKELAENLIRELDKNASNKVEFIIAKANNDYF